MNAEMSAALIGALVGGAVAFLGTFLTQRDAAIERRRGVAIALQGELDRLSHLVRPRDLLAIAEWAQRGPTGLSFHPWIATRLQTNEYVDESSLQDLMRLDEELGALLEEAGNLAVYMHDREMSPLHTIPVIVAEGSGFNMRLRHLASACEALMISARQRIDRIRLVNARWVTKRTSWEYLGSVSSTIRRLAQTPGHALRALAERTRSRIRKR